MTVFVDIGAKRIQTYLARTPSLKGRRGASSLLDRRVLHEITASVWRPVAIENTAAKRTDGLLSFEITDDAALDAAQRLVAGVVAALRAHAPGAEWEITVAEGTDYQTAQKARKVAERRGGHRWLTDVSGLGVVAAVAPLGEVPVVRLCDACGLDPAVSTVREEGKEGARCADCVRRLAEARASTPAEDALRAGVHRQTPELGNVRVADTFAELAEQETGGNQDRNHLCTVFVDGNRFGDLFQGLTGSGVDLGALSVNLAAAMNAALVTATVAISDPGASTPVLPVIPHLVGGDDLVASVVADRAWEFTRALLADYRDRVAALVAPHGVISAPTASAGLVFAQVTFPFATSVALAETALRRAKAEHAAQHPALLWTDVTADGPRTVTGRSSITLDDLNKFDADLRALAVVPASGRTRLGQAWTRIPGRAADAAAAQAIRLGIHDTVRPFLTRGTALPLPDALSILRWWRP